MALENIALISIKRSDFAGPMQCQQRSEENSTEGATFSLFEQVKQTFNRSAAKRFGFFDADSEYQQVVGLIKNWASESINFLSLANKMGDLLQQQLDVSETPFTASLIIAKESILGQNYLYCFWVNSGEVIQAGADLEPYMAEVLEPTKIQYALRLHMDEWQSGESPKYLTQLAVKGNKDLGEAFKRFSNFSEGIDINAQTTEFLQILEDYSEELPEEESKKLKGTVLDYCVEQDKVGSPVVVADISEQVSADAPEKFAEYVNSRQEVPQAEVHTDRQSLKRYMRYFGRDNSLSISFSAERFGQDIAYDPARSSLTISKLPKSLKVQLSGHHNKLED